MAAGKQPQKQTNETKRSADAKTAPKRTWMIGD
jgi:hypothetical protein